MCKDHKGFACQPKKLVAQGSLSVFLLCLALSSFSQGDTWQQKQSLGMPTVSRYQSVSFSINSKGYVGTGSNLKDFWEYDPATDVWTQKADFAGGGRSSATGFSIGNKGYIGSGNTGSTVYSDFWEYDLATNAWTRKADFGGGIRTGAIGFSIGAKGYMGTGGKTASGPSGSYTNDFWEYDPATDLWAQKANFPGTARSEASGLSIGSKGYIGLGTSPLMDLFSDFWEYEPATNVWVQKANFGGGGRCNAVSFSIGNIGLVGTGYPGFSAETKDFWAYDPATNTWVKKANFGGLEREEAIGFSIGNKGYIGTGWRPPVSNTAGSKTDFWEYDIATDAWAQKADLGGGPRVNAPGFSIAGKGYVGTGFDGGGGAKSDFWEYDPATNVWVRKTDFAGGLRREATGFSLGNVGYLGQGYVSARTTFTNDFWKYDPLSNTWTRGTNPTGSARAKAVSFGANGKEYFGFGYINASNLNDFWEFDPATGIWTQKAGVPELAGANLSFVIGNKGYVFSLFNVFWEYDPLTNTWTQKPNPGISGINHAFSINNKGYVFTSSNALWEYNATTGTWVARASFPGPARQDGTAFSIGNNGYFGFGSSGNGFQNDFWEYIPAQDNSITVNVTPTVICSGSTVAISYTATGTFNAGNIFTVELSDSLGNFSQPKVIGRDTSTTSDILNITVPDSISTGYAYRMRVVSSNPAITGSSNGVNLTINAPVANSQNFLRIYLNSNGNASVTPQHVDNGSTGCGTLKLVLNDTSFNCQDIGANNKVVLTVTDGNGNKATDTTVIIVFDTLSPVVKNAFALPNILWPADHSLRQVVIFYNEKDNCSIADKSLSVTSNEPPTGNRPDWVILDDHRLLLRASRKAQGNGRIYYITITVKDSSGNTDTKVVRVIVPNVGLLNLLTLLENDQAFDNEVARIKSGETETAVNGLSVHALPNPTSKYFTLNVRSNSKESITVRVVNITGQVIESRTVASNITLQVGSDYKPGSYFVQVVQGNDRKTLHLVKQPN
jgi:N-acetylneuraminic acid mutarotase